MSDDVGSDIWMRSRLGEPRAGLGLKHLQRDQQYCDYQPLTAAEAVEFFEAIAYYFEDAQDDPGWYHHIGGDCGREQTIAIGKTGPNRLSRAPRR